MLESARKGHRRAMRHMDRAGRRRYAKTMTDERERDMVGAISAELDEEDRMREEREARRRGRRGNDSRDVDEEREEREERDDLDAKMARMARTYAREFGAQLKARGERAYDVRASKFTKDVTPRVAAISARLLQHGMSPKAFQASCASRGIDAAIAKHVPPALRHDMTMEADGPAALEASASQFTSMKAMLGGVA